MSLITFRKGGRQAIGCLVHDDHDAVDLAAALPAEPAFFSSMQDLIGAGPPAVHFHG